MVSRVFKLDRQRQKNMPGVHISESGTINVGKVVIFRNAENTHWIFPGGLKIADMSEAIARARRLQFEVYGDQSIATS